MIIHKCDEGRYLCNNSTKPLIEKMTANWDLVTCKNCLKVTRYEVVQHD